MQPDCTEMDKAPESHWRSFEGCTGVFGLGVAGAIEHSSGDCTFGVTDIGSDTRTQMRSIAVR